MVPSNNSPLYLSFQNVIRYLCQALWWEDAMNFAHFSPSRYNVIHPKGTVLQGTHQEANPFDGPVHVARHSINHPTCYEDLEQCWSLVSQAVHYWLHKASIANPTENMSRQGPFHHVSVQQTAPANLIHREPKKGPMVWLF